MKLHLKQHKRYIVENNYFFRTSGDMWFDVMNQYEGIGKVLFMTRVFKIYSIHIDFVIKLNVGWKFFVNWILPCLNRKKSHFSTHSLRIIFTLICSQFNLTPAGTFLSVISIISLVLYFVTSSDSGSLVIDCLSANGHPDPPVIQRIFWAVTEGACATGLLVAGGSKALTALQVWYFVCLILRT